MSKELMNTAISAFNLSMLLKTKSFSNSRGTFFKFQVLPVYCPSIRILYFLRVQQTTLILHIHWDFCKYYVLFHFRLSIQE